MLTRFTARIYVVSTQRARRDRLPLPRRGSRCGRAAPRRGTGNLPRSRGGSARLRPRSPRDLFGERGLSRAPRAPHAAARARDDDRAARRRRLSHGGERLGLWHRGELLRDLLVLRPRRDALDARRADRRERFRPARGRRRFLRRLPAHAARGREENRGCARVSSLGPVEADDSVVLKVVSGESEAEVVCGLLRTAGIDCAYRDTEAIDSPLEDFIAAGSREILVHAADLEAAKELLAASRVN